MGSPKIREWVAYPFSSGSSQPRNQTGVSCIAGGFFFYQLSYQGSPGYGQYEVIRTVRWGTKSLGEGSIKQVDPSYLEVELSSTCSLNISTITGSECFPGREGGDDVDSTGLAH